MIIWDIDKVPLKDAGDILLWQGYKEEKSVKSISRYLEENAEHFRSKYISFIHELGESRIQEKRLIEHFSYENKFSYWWLTLFVEQSPWKTPSIIDALKVLALEKLLLDRKPKKIILFSRNVGLNTCICNLCDSLDIEYEWARVIKSPLLSSIEFLKNNSIAIQIKSLISLSLYLVKSWGFRKAKTNEWFDDNNIFICSYFDNIDPEEANHGTFKSLYWGKLHTLLRANDIKQNWLHIFVPSELVSSRSDAISLTNKFNSKKNNQSFHTFVGSFITLGIAVNIIQSWIWLIKKYFVLRNVKKNFVPNGSNFSLWPLFEKDWKNSIFGPVAINNLLFLNIFDKIFKEMPYQKKGLFLGENHAWERALIFSWRKYGHGPLYSVQHSMIRFWDLRYFNDLRTILSEDSNPIPRANFMVLNGKMSAEVYRNLSYPEEILVECEALRYEYLSKIKFRNNVVNGSTINKYVNILVLGDYTQSGTDELMHMLESAVGDITKNIVFTVKPHPNLLISAESYPNLDYKITNQSLDLIITDFDIAYSGNLSGGSLDAYLMGLPVIVLLEDLTLNFSPLRGVKDVNFVNTPNELAMAINTASHLKHISNNDINDFFYLDESMPKWSRLLKS